MKVTNRLANPSLQNEPTPAPLNILNVPDPTARTSNMLPALQIGRIGWLFMTALGLVALGLVVFAFFVSNESFLWIALVLAFSVVVTLAFIYFLQKSLVGRAEEQRKTFIDVVANADRAQRTLRSGLEGMSDALLLTDIEGRMIYWNKPADDLLRWFRVSSKTFKSIDEWLAPLRPNISNKDAFKLLLVRARQLSGQGQVPSFEFGVERPLTQTISEVDTPLRPTPFLDGMGENGRDPAGDLANRPVRDLRMTLFPIDDASGRQIGTGYLLRDVTRDRELDRLKDQFVSMVSHEIRNPLSTILTMTELLQMDDLTFDERLKWVRQINTETLRLRSMLNDLLDISRLEEGKLDMMLTPVDVAGTIQELLENFRLEQTNHQLVFDVQTTKTRVVADSGKLTQILINLINNAIKYSPKGGEVRVLVRDGKTDEENPESVPVEISVADQGMGIPEKEQPKIFARFYRSSTSKRSGIGGTGLGLSITQRLVKLQGGEIWFTSEEGKGTTFYFTLPPAPPRNR